MLVGKWSPRASAWEHQSIAILQNKSMGILLNSNIVREIDKFRVQMLLVFPVEWELMGEGSDWMDDKIAETNQWPKCGDTFISGCPFEEIDCNKTGHGNANHNVLRHVHRRNIQTGHQLQGDLQCFFLLQAKGATLGDLKLLCHVRHTGLKLVCASHENGVII